MRIRLPVSGQEVSLRAPDGSDELSLCETSGPPVARALALLERLADPADCGDLPVPDFEFLLLVLRAEMLGDQLDLGFACPACAARVEVSFHLERYLRGLKPRTPGSVRPDRDRTGWFRCDDIPFRLPTVADQAAVAGRPDAARRLAQLCVGPPVPAARQRERIERAMAAMAPELSRPLVGECPDCGVTVEAPLHVSRLVVGEFARDSASLHDDLDVIAGAYHWREADILALPRVRRQAYAARIRHSHSQAA